MKAFIIGSILGVLHVGIVTYLCASLSDPQMERISSGFVFGLLIASAAIVAVFVFRSS